MDRNGAKGLTLLLFLIFINFANARVVRSGPSDSLDFQTNGVNSRLEILSSGEVSAKTRFKMLDSMVFTPLTQINRNGLTPEDGLAIWNTDSDELNIYDATTTLWRHIVDMDSAQELTLKTIDGDNNIISNLFHGSEVDNPVSGVHGVVGNVVGTTDAQTLTNKTYDADSNILNNVSDTNIKIGAAISRPKLADGTANYVLINNGTGVISEEQFLDKTRGGTGITSTATFPSSGTVVTETGAQIITLKDYDVGTASNTSRLTLGQETTVNLDLLTDKKGTLAYDTDLDTVVVNNGTDWIGISGGGGGGAIGFTASELYGAQLTPAAAVNINLADIILDTNSAWSAVNDEYTIPTTGQYLITAGATFTNMREVYFYYVSLYKNGVELDSYWKVNNRFKPAAVAGVQAAGFNGVPTGIVSLLAGDKISLQVTGKSIDVSETGTVRHLLSIAKVGAADAAGGIGEEIIGARASMNHGQVLGVSTLDKMEFDTIENDTHGNFDPTTNYRYTVGSGQAGYYDINYNISITAGAGVTWANCQIIINGSGTEVENTNRADPIDTQWYPYSGHSTENLAVGDTVEIFCRSQTGPSTHVLTGAIGSTFSVYKKAAAGITVNAVAIATSTAAQLVTALGTSFGAENEIKDTYGLYNPALGEFTCDRNGTLTVLATARTESVNLSTSQVFAANLYKNGSNFARIDIEKGNGVALKHGVSGTIIVDCVVNDAFRVNLSSSINVNLTAIALENRVSFILE